MINQEELKQMLHYDHMTGVFTWLRRELRWFKTKRAYTVWNSQHPDKEAGSYLKCGNVYWTITVRNKSYLAHRLAWLYMTGVWPGDQLDHINGDGVDNRWVNLREVTNAENGRNCKTNSNNTSGVMGVYLYKRDNIWCAYITINHKTKYLGRFNDFFEAVCSRKSAELWHDFHHNHGCR